jgi:hypothetical protein
MGVIVSNCIFEDQRSEPIGGDMSDKGLNKNTPKKQKRMTTNGITYNMIFIPLILLSGNKNCQNKGPKQFMKIEHQINVLR